MVVKLKMKAILFANIFFRNAQNGPQLKPLYFFLIYYFSGGGGGGRIVTSIVAQLENIYKF